MSFLDHLRPHFERISAMGEDVGQHQAAVDLLVLAASTDSRVSEQERSAIEAFDTAHTDWDDAVFDVPGYLPTAVAKARDTEQGALLEDIAARLTSVVLRQDALAVARQLASADGASPAFLADLDRAFT